MKVAKLLLAAAIAAPSLFLTSCEKQIDVQAETMNREATRSLARPAAVEFNFITAPATEEAPWSLTAYNLAVTCGTGTFQQLVGTKWVDVSDPMPLDGIFITYSPIVAPAAGTQIRVFFVPAKGKSGCPDNLQRGGTNVYTVQ
jgi:hypothetical protein